MAFIPTPNCIELALHYNINNEAATNIFHVDNHGTVLDADLDAAAVALGDWWSTSLTTAITTFTVATSVVATDISAEGGHQFTLSAFDQPGGDQSAGALTSNTSAIVTWHSAQVGRSFRGRSYIGGVPNDAVTDNALESGYITTLQAAVDDLLADMVAAGFTPVILSLSHNKAPRSAGLMVEITSGQVRTYLGTQRRRIKP